MTYKTHIAFAIAAALPISNNSYGLTSFESLIFLFFTVIGALAPDFDEEGSYLSKRLPIFPMLLKLFGVTHRGVTHWAISIFVLVLFFLVIGFFGEIDTIYHSVAYGFIFGYLFHQFGDMLTKGGINNFFYPFSEMKVVLLPKKYRFYTNSRHEFFVFIFFCAIIVFESLYFQGIINVKFL